MKILKIVTGQGPISGTCYQRKLAEYTNLKLATGDGQISGM